MPERFIKTSWTRFHITENSFVVWTTRDGQYLFFRTEDRTLPLATVYRSGGRWYTRCHWNNRHREKSEAFDDRDDAFSDAVARTILHGAVAPRRPFP